MTNYIEFAAKIKEKYPQYKDVDDLTLAKKVVEKYPQYKEKVEFEEVKTEPKRETKKNLDLTPSGLAKGAASNISALLRMPIYGEDFKTAKDNANLNIQRAEQKHPVLLGGAEFVNDLAGYSMLPYTRGGSVVNFIKNAAIQGGVPGAVEGLKHGGDVGSAAGGAGTGATIAGILQSLPYAGKLLSKPVQYVGKKAVEALTDLKPETFAQVIKPNSKALDLTEGQAQNLLMNTTERVRNNYKSLLNDRGNEVGDLLNKLPEDKTFKAKEIVEGYDPIYNSYSLSKNQDLNPARNATQREYDRIKELLYGDGKQRIEEFKNSLDELAFPKSYLDTIKGRYKNKYYNKTLDTLENDIIKSERGFNEDIIQKIKNNPELLKNPEAINNLENEVAKYAKYTDEDLNRQFYDKFWEAVQKGDILEEGQNFVNPKELYDLNKNISNWIDWDKPGAALKNDVLEQFYLSNANKISQLSPELKAANKAYADLMDFQKNEGIRRILNNQNNIDTASSALKNYNSTVTKGNTNRNIQDLENLLTKNGYEPFLNDIDDVNAAMDLLTQPKTGRNFLGAQTLAKGLIIPALKGIRNAKQKGIDGKLSNKVNELKALLMPINKVLPSAGAKAGANMLYGGVEYNDYQ